MFVTEAGPANSLRKDYFKKQYSLQNTNFDYEMIEKQQSAVKFQVKTC